MIRVLFALLLLSSSVVAQTTREELKVGAGSLVVIKAPAPPAGDSKRSVVWAVLDPIDRNFYADTSGEAIALVGPTANEKIVVAADIVDWDARKFEKRIWVVTVGGDFPVRPDPITPPPIPVVVPDGWRGLTKAAYNASRSVAPAARRAAALQIRMASTKQLPKLQDYFTAVDDALEPLTKDDAALTKCMGDLETILDGLWGADKTTLRSAEDAVAALKAIADGMEL